MHRGGVKPGGVQVCTIFHMVGNTGELHILYNVHDVLGCPRRRTVGLILFSLECCRYGAVDLCIAQLKQSTQTS